jgi:hypothetical protein
MDRLFQMSPNFCLNINYINPLINAMQKDYISYQAEMKDYIIFSRTMGSEAWLYFSDYTINTDESIWPYPYNTVRKGWIAQEKSINHPYTVGPRMPLVTLILAKSSNSLVYDRQVQKVAAVFSYVGGLVGAVTAFLFLVKSYTDSSL